MKQDMGKAIYEQRTGIFFASATFGAFINKVPDGFRIESVSFLTLMFYDWVAPAVHRSNHEDLTTGVVSYVKQLQEDGFVKRQGRSNPPRYTVTNDGLIELVLQVVRRGYYDRLDDFFFVHSYIENYSPRTLHLLERDPGSYPYQLKVQMEALLDLQEFTREQLKYVSNELKALHARMEVQEEVYDKVMSLRSEKSVEEILDIVSIENPYVLDSKRPLESFVERGNERRILWEITEGGMRRNKQMWSFRKEQLELHKQHLECLLDSTRERQKSDHRLLALKELPDMGPFKK